MNCWIVNCWIERPLRKVACRPSGALFDSTSIVALLDDWFLLRESRLRDLIRRRRDARKRNTENGISAAVFTLCRLKAPSPTVDRRNQGSLFRGIASIGSELEGPESSVSRPLSIRSNITCPRGVGVADAQRRRQATAASSNLHRLKGVRKSAKVEPCPVSNRSV
jgi:hypothetical protein